MELRVGRPAHAALRFARHAAVGSVHARVAVPGDVRKPLNDFMHGAMRLVNGGVGFGGCGSV
jgi:hypothetical protein